MFNICWKLENILHNAPFGPRRGKPGKPPRPTGWGCPGSPAAAAVPRPQSRTHGGGTGTAAAAKVRPGPPGAGARGPGVKPGKPPGCQCRRDSPRGGPSGAAAAGPDPAPARLSGAGGATRARPGKRHWQAAGPASARRLESWETRRGESRIRGAAAAQWGCGLRCGPPGPAGGSGSGESAGTGTTGYSGASHQCGPGGPPSLSHIGIFLCTRRRRRGVLGASRWARGPGVSATQCRSQWRALAAARAGQRALSGGRFKSPKLSQSTWQGLASKRGAAPPMRGASRRESGCRHCKAEGAQGPSQGGTESAG